LDGREQDSSGAGNLDLPCSIIAWSNDDFSDIGAFARQHGFHSRDEGALILARKDDQTR
jgi:hypothetical protein